MNPIGYIDEEMNLLAAEIAGVAGYNLESSTTQMINDILDNWVKKKVVRFHYVQPRRTLGTGRIDGLEKNLLDRFLDNNRDDIQEMAGCYSDEEDDLALTWYMISFKENF